MATRTVSKAGGIWSEVTAWVEGEVPTSADDVVDTAESGELKLEATGNCRSIVLEHCKFTQGEVSLNIGTSTPGPENVALKFGSGMTYTHGTNLCSLVFKSTSATQQTINFGGHGIQKMTISSSGNGNYKQVGAVACSNFSVEKGIYSTNGETLSATAISSTGSNTRTFNIENSTLSANTTGESWKVEGTNLTLLTAGSEVKLTRSTGSITFNGGGNTYNIVNFTSNSGPTMTILGANKIKKLILNRKQIIKLQIEKIQEIEELVAIGAAAELITIQSTEVGKQGIIKKTSGEVKCDYLKLQDTKAEGGAKFLAGAHSEFISNVTGWTLGVGQEKPKIGVSTSEVTIADTLKSQVNPGGLPAEYWFEWGLTESYGNKTAIQNLEVGNTEKPVSALITGLTGGTTYHFRVVARNEEGETKGADTAFIPTKGASVYVITE